VLILLLLFFLFTKPVLAVEPIIKITNYSSNSSPEWVEINNQTDTAIDINNWTIRDGNSNLTDDLTITGCLSPHSYVTFYHNSGWLNDSSPETISLYDISNSLIDRLSYSKGQLNLNPRSDNTCVPNPTPLPTSIPTPIPTATPIPLPTITPLPTPTNTPHPTNTPIPTNTPTHIPTLTPTPTVTSVPTFTPIPTIKPTITPTIDLNQYNSSDESTISAIFEPSSVINSVTEEITLDTVTPTSEPILGETTTTKRNFLPLIFICLGGIFLLAPLIIAKIKSKPNVKKNN
jgi:hypothetical protein